MRQHSKLIFLTFYIPITLLVLFLAVRHASAITVTKSNLNSGLVGWWTFDGKDMLNGVARDVTGNGHTGTLRNIATTTFYTAGKLGQAVNLDGADDTVNMGDVAAIDGLANLSVSFWAKASTFSGNPFLVSKWDNNFTGPFTVSCYPISLTCGMYVTTINGFVIGTAPIPTVGEWHHFVGVYNGSTILFYIDGVPGTPASLTGNLISDSSPLIVGNDATGASAYKGVIDDLRIYNRPLSNAEVQKIYNGGVGAKQSIAKARLTTGLVGWWTFDGKDVVNGVIRDASGNANNAAPINIASSTFYKPGKIGQGANFDGFNDVLSIADSSSLRPATTTIALWFKCTNFVGSWAVVSKPRSSAPWSSPFTSWLIRLNTSTTIELGVSGAAYSGETSFPPGGMLANQWYHIALVANNNVKTGYFNGVQYFTGSYTGPIGYGSFPVLLGADHGSSPYGDIAPCIEDDVRIYNRALSAAEIRTIYELATSTRVGLGTQRTVTGGLVARWTFDGKDMPNGVAKDVTGNSNNGALFNIASSTFYVPGKIGQGLKFDGVNDYIDAGDITNADNVAALTVSIWAKSNAADIAVGEEYITKWRSGFDTWYIDKFTNEQVAFRLCNTTPTCVNAQSGPLADTNWHNYTGVYDGANVILYVDGVATSSAALTGTVKNTTDHVCIGGDYTGSACQNGFNGSLDEARIYNRALTPSEVKQLYIAGR